MTTQRTNLLSLIFIAIPVVLTLYLYPSLPEQIPTHWNITGEVDAYMPKPVGVLVLPLAAAFILLIMKLIPLVSPKGFQTDEFRGVVNIFTVTLVGFVSGVALLVLLAATGRDVHVNELVFAGVGLLFIVLGNYLGKVRKNFFIGIRTPWTLASDEVWAKTHRLGGWMFVLAGLVLALSGIFGVNEIVLASTIVIAAVIPIAYSFILYQRIEGFGPDED